VTAAKELKGMVIPVIVNIHSEMGALPAKVKEANPGGPYPFVIFADPAMDKIYGTYNHTQLKGQDYRSIFRDAKKTASADIRNKTFNIALDAQAGNKDEGGEKKGGDDGKIVKVEDSEIQTWTSSAGTTIKAKLVAVENRTTFVFTTAAGRTIRVTADKLSPASAKAARELAGIE
jgi:hypothetical protein